jgi:NAD kinase
MVDNNENIISLKTGDNIIVRKSKQKARIIRLPKKENVSFGKRYFE